MAAKRRISGWLIALVVVGAIALWVSGAFDRQLADVGLNSQTCAQNLFGAKICGDELVAFCKENYDADINADTCDDVLRDAGTSGEAIERDRRATARRRTQLAREQARVVAAFDTTVPLGTIAYRVRRVHTVDQISGQLGTETPKSGNVFVVTDLTYRNTGNEPLDLLCGGADNFRLTDSRDRRFSPDDDTMYAVAENDEGCSREVQPGESEDAAIVFQVPSTVAPAELLIGQPNETPPGTARYLEVGLPSS